MKINTVKSRKDIGFPQKNQWCNMPAKYTKNSLIIAGHSVMEKWETNYMKMLAAIVTKNRGSILEVGYGLGIATNFIRKYKGLNGHVIIEYHPEVLNKCKTKYAKEIKMGKMIPHLGLWEEVVPKLISESFDGILFDTYPLSEEQIHKNHFWFFEEAYRMLKPSGILTYYSDEADKFSNEHIKKLRSAGFKKIDYKICKVSPPKDCMYWNKKSMIAPIIIK